MKVTINHESGLPIYRQVVDQIKLQVVSGEVRKGVKLPSVRSLAAELNITPATVVKAYNELNHQGVVMLKHGKGAFVTGRMEVISEVERDALKRLAKQFVFEAAQMGVLDQVEPEIVVQIFRQALMDARTHL